MSQKAELTISVELHEADDLLDYLNGPKWKIALQSVEERLRRMVKYEDKATIAIEDARNIIREEMSTYDL